MRSIFESFINRVVRVHRKTNEANSTEVSKRNLQRFFFFHFHSIFRPIENGCIRVWRGIRTAFYYFC